MKKRKITQLAWIWCSAVRACGSKLRSQDSGGKGMATAHLLRRASSAFLFSTTNPLRSCSPLVRLQHPRAAMATDSSTAPFQKIQIQREDTVRYPFLSLPSPLSPPSLHAHSTFDRKGSSRVYGALPPFNPPTLHSNPTCIWRRLPGIEGSPNHVRFV